MKKQTSQQTKKIKAERKKKLQQKMPPRIKNKKPELLCPVQDFTSLTAAIQNGADAVFFGVKGFNMREGAKNFTLSDLPKITKIAKESGVKTYLALNTIIFEDELKKVEKIIVAVKKAGVTAVICWDHSVINLAKKNGVEFHISTQASIANSESALHFKKLGATRVVLARECNLKQIKQIKQKAGVEVEIFIHGAMCVSVSGRCFLSQFMYGKSANRGECGQPCRKKYLIKQIDGGHELDLGSDYVMSPKDLCTIEFIEKILELDVDCLKIEGRNRSPEYVATVTKTYRTAIDYYYANKNRRGFKKDFEILKKTLSDELTKVFNRGQSDGFFLGKPINEWSRMDGNQSKQKKIRVGVVTHFFSKINVAEIKIQGKQSFKIGDVLYIQGPTTGILKQKVTRIEAEHVEIKNTKNKPLVAIKVDSKIKKGDEVYIVK